MKRARSRPGSLQRIARRDPSWLLGIFVLAALLALPGCGNSSGEPAHGAGNGEDEQNQEDDAIAVRVRSVARAPITALYGTSATLRADKRAVVTARTRGVVRSLLVEEGDIVSSGQALARLEAEEQQIERDKAVTTRDTRWREFERARSLHEQGLLSDEEFETARREAEESKQSAALAELILSRTVIRAPFGGSILHRHLDVGATVADGTSVFDIADLDPLYADVNVPERHIARLAVGQQVRLVADSSGAVARARIERIAPSVEPTSGTVKVTLAVGYSAEMRPGSFVRVEIVTDTHAHALVVPRSALVAEGRRWYLFRLAPDGESVERLQVTRGYEERERVEIAGAANGSGALAEGDRIVVTGATALTDEARIRIVEPEAEGEEEQAQELSADEDEQSGVGS